MTHYMIIQLARLIHNPIIVFFEDGMTNTYNSEAIDKPALCLLAKPIDDLDYKSYQYNVVDRAYFSNERATAIILEASKNGNGAHSYALALKDLCLQMKSHLECTIRNA